MKCKQCGLSDEFNNGYCLTCVQTLSPLEKYPFLENILTKDSIHIAKRIRQDSSDEVVKTICQVCHCEFDIKFVSLLKQFRKKIKLDTYTLYQCHKCSKKGKTGISLDSVLPRINLQKTEEKFGGIPKNVKKGKVVAICEDCGLENDIKLGNLLHQARRHSQNGRSCIYKCFSCGIKREDSIEKTNNARVKQLKDGFISSLEASTISRLNSLGIKYIHQYQTDMYVWDFYLIDYNLLVDVNGEYWHSLPKNVSKDKSKITYIERYKPEFETLIIDEKNFLNPLMIDRIILDKIGVNKPIQTIDFDFKDVKVEVKDNNDEIKNFFSSFHYAAQGRKGKFIICAYTNNILIGVAKFNNAVRNEVASSRGLKNNQILELDRFCIDPRFQKKNFATWFLSKCIKLVFSEFKNVSELVSFSDPTFGHEGIIYKASNWIFVGKTSSSYHYMDKSGIPINKKRVYDMASKLRMKESEYVEKHGLTKIKEKPKFKFVYPKKRNTTDKNNQ